MSYVEINSIHKSFNNIKVLKDIDFSIEKGEFLTLLGPSGCGKSTLLRCIAGLNNFENGSIIIDNKNIGNVKPKDRQVGMVFQSYALFPNMTVYENIAFGLKIKKFFVYKKRPDRQNARWTLFISVILFSPQSASAYSSLSKVYSALLPAKHLIKEPFHVG